jgi:hypothetical protein
MMVDATGRAATDATAPGFALGGHQVFQVLERRGGRHHDDVEFTHQARIGVTMPKLTGDLLVSARRR